MSVDAVRSNELAVDINPALNERIDRECDPPNKASTDKRSS